MYKLLIFSLILVPIPALTQQGTSRDPTPVPIQDNSFLVEEAYNQGRGIVQHISTFAKSRNDNGWAYSCISASSILSTDAVKKAVMC